jgi:uncharacterized membrane protein
MVKLLTNLNYTVTSGVVLLIVLIVIVAAWHSGMGAAFDHAWWTVLVRWLHVISGIMWIGLLYYLNFVQVPTMPKIPEAQRPAVTGHIAPAVLFWFRWGAMSTIIWGIILAWMSGYLVDAIAIGLTDGVAKHTQIGIGMWLGTIMWFNVWFVIWPNQKIALGIIQKEGADRAKAGRTAMLFSRTNTMLSIPMLWCMVTAQNVF